jgi:hypothetical protein
VDYGTNSYWFRGAGSPTNIIDLAEDEVITELTTYHDANRTYTPYQTIVGIKIKTNLGTVHGPFGPTANTQEYIFTGLELLYFHGRAGAIPDAIGVNFAC